MSLTAAGGRRTFIERHYLGVSGRVSHAIDGITGAWPIGRELCAPVAAAFGTRKWIRVGSLVEVGDGPERRR